VPKVLQLTTDSSRPQSGRLFLAVWFGFFGAFLIGSSWRFSAPQGLDRLITIAMMIYGVLFLGYYPVISRPRFLRAYTGTMVLGALALSGRLVYVAVERPAAYRHWNDWLLLAFLLLGMWSLLPALRWAAIRPGAKSRPGPG
jgi:hypothetical protein